MSLENALDFAMDAADRFADGNHCDFAVHDAVDTETGEHVTLLVLLDWSGCDDEELPAIRPVGRLYGDMAAPLPVWSGRRSSARFQSLETWDGETPALEY